MQNYFSIKVIYLVLFHSYFLMDLVKCSSLSRAQKDVFSVESQLEQNWLKFELIHLTLM